MTGKSTIFKDFTSLNHLLDGGFTLTEMAGYTTLLLLINIKTHKIKRITKLK